MDDRAASDSPVQAFYDGLASNYHLLYDDWEEAIGRHAAVLDGLLAERMPARGSLLDCTCGIGTQALGLAQLGWTVHGTDLSAPAVARAAHEAVKRGIALTTGVADIRRLATDVTGSFDAVISCDNSIAHLLTFDELVEALHGMRARLRSKGVALVTLRDYDALRKERPTFTSQRVVDGPTGRRVVFQVWDWTKDGTGYVGNLFILLERSGQWTTVHQATRFHAFLRSELERAAVTAELNELRWTAPSPRYGQWVLTARRTT